MAIVKNQFQFKTKAGQLDVITKIVDKAFERFVGEDDNGVYKEYTEKNTLVTITVHCEPKQTGRLFRSAQSVLKQLEDGRLVDLSK